jgi:hypothetical protein
MLVALDPRRRDRVLRDPLLRDCALVDSTYSRSHLFPLISYPISF